jgi:DNA-directed RNA polymerase subunit RPC12/RpoP
MATYRTAYFCVSCKEEMSFETMMHSHGRCPHCGFKHPSACTVVACFERGYYYKKINPWWKIWKKQFERTLLPDDKKLYDHYKN